VDLLKRPRVEAEDLLRFRVAPEDGVLSDAALAAVEIELKYEGYVARERERADRLRKQANLLLHNDLPYSTMITLSFEAREKLARIRPETLAQAARIQGVSPADLQNLLLEARRWSVAQKAGAPTDV
jgi:tRNA uridine 5-carboxymethylaminomethyl modification enzyme